MPFVQFEYDQFLDFLKNFFFEKIFFQILQNLEKILKINYKISLSVIKADVNIECRIC